MNSEIRKTLEAVKNGELSVDDALLAIKKEPFEDIGYAKVDLHRGIRQGAAEVIYGAGKTPEQMTWKDRGGNCGNFRHSGGGGSSSDSGSPRE